MQLESRNIKNVLQNTKIPNSDGLEFQYKLMSYRTINMITFYG